LSSNRHHQFDFLPVTEAATGPMKIVGLLEVALYKRSATTDALVGEVMRPLSEENLIGADASILAFVRDADRRKCRLVVSGHEIGGLISLSDLQRLPVRAALFGLVTYFEILMASAIRWEFDGSEGWLEYVSEDRQRGLREKLEKAQAADGLVDPLLFTQFGDKKSILRRSTYLETSRGEFERELDKIQSLRKDCLWPISEATAARRRVRLLMDGKTVAIAPRVDNQCRSVWRCCGYVLSELLPDGLADQKSGLSACGIGWRF
jgi:hypothetical protein